MKQFLSLFLLMILFSRSQASDLPKLLNFNQLELSIYYQKLNLLLSEPFLKESFDELLKKEAALEACKIQLNTKLVPTECYMYVKRHSGELKIKGHTLDMLSFLDDFCERGVLIITEVDYLDQYLKKKQISNKCRMHINKKRGILVYKLIGLNME